MVGLWIFTNSWTDVAPVSPQKNDDRRYKEAGGQDDKVSVGVTISDGGFGRVFGQAIFHSRKEPAGNSRSILEGKYRPLRETG